MPWLTAGGVTYQLQEGDSIVGSGPETAWRVTTADLMPRHFVIGVSGERATVRPFSTDIVVALNGDQIGGSPHSLSDGDIVEAGSGRFAYGEAAPRHDTGSSVRTTAYLVDERWKVSHPLESRSTTIGRDASNAISVRDPTASRFHAEVRREAGGFALHSMGSSGTNLNGRLVGSPCLLSEGDTIEIAYSTFRFTAEAPSGEVTLAPMRVPVNDETARRPTLMRERVSLSNVPIVQVRRRRNVWILVAALIGLAIMAAILTS